VYKECCITGERALLEIDRRMPPDIVACHIFPFAYQDVVSTFFHYLSAELISVQWVSSGWPSSCTDRGPGDDCSHDYTGYHQICCLNNMIPLRADIRYLWDAYEIGVDVRVSTPIA
jgi:hypothetical protein